MKAQELRIGNWIHSGVIDKNMPPQLVGDFQVEAWHITAMQDFENLSRVFVDMKPIPLTEEWLLKFGCIKEDLFDYCNYWNQDEDFSIDVHYERSDNGVQPLFYYVLSDVGLGRKKHLIYVHQLQNLHFALNGTELQLK